MLPHELVIAEKNARREGELAEERRLSDLAIAEERRLSDIAISEEKGRRERELAEQKRKRDLEEAEKREQELINNNQSLEIQLTERINELKLLQQQREDERNKLTNDANNLSIVNTRLQEEIVKLSESMNNLSTSTDSAELQNELENIKLQSKQNLGKQKQYEQNIEQLNQQLVIIQKKQLEANVKHEQKENEVEELQQQIHEIKNSRSQVESNLEQLRINEENSQKIVAKLEQQLANQRLVQKQLKNQLDVLKSSLSESQKREQELEKRANQAQAQSEALAEEMERYIEETGKHPLNDFEVAIKKSLEDNFSDARVEIQFDVGSGKQGSRFTDFIVVMNNCCIILEAKSYKGLIKPIDDVRNSGWICQQAGRKLHIFSCWGKNPYHQLKTYCDSLMKNRTLGIHNKFPVYGVIVFPKGSCIDNSIKSNIDQFYRVTTLDNLSSAIQELDNQANSWN
ncbi:NERD domain-containing protein [Nostoc sp. FACHB-133]|nr:NERD domain-containing protein [Nostoc sp. FACHB-133]